jgi:hypothetical protein
LPRYLKQRHTSTQRRLDILVHEREIFASELDRKAYTL